MTQLSLSKGEVTQDMMTSKLYDYLIQFFFWQKDPKIARYFEQGLGGVNKGFKSLIIIGKKSGEISPDKDPAVLADFLSGLFYGLQAMENGSLSKNSLNHIISNALSDLN